MRVNPPATQEENAVFTQGRSILIKPQQLLLNPGDPIYCVYESALFYQEESYDIIDYVDQEYYENGTAPYDPKLIACQVSQPEAETQAKSLHQQRILEIKAFTLFREEPGDEFDIYDWCEENNLSLLDEDDDEIHWQGKDFLLEPEDLVIKKLQQERKVELLEQLWDLLGYGKLAFVHQQIFKGN